MKKVFIFLAYILFLVPFAGIMCSFVLYMFQFLFYGISDLLFDPPSWHGFFKRAIIISIIFYLFLSYIWWNL